MSPFFFQMYCHKCHKLHRSYYKMYCHRSHKVSLLKTVLKLSQMLHHPKNHFRYFRTEIEKQRRNWLTKQGEDIKHSRHFRYGGKVQSHQATMMTQDEYRQNFVELRTVPVLLRNDTRTLKVNLPLRRCQHEDIFTRRSRCGAGTARSKRERNGEYSKQSQLTLN